MADQVEGVPGEARRVPSGDEDRRQDIRRVEQAITRIGRIANGREAARIRAERSGVQISKPGITILSALHARGPLRPTELAAHTRLELTLVSREVRRLVVDGYVASRADDTDGRAAIASLTDEGSAAFRSYRAATDDILAETFGTWAPTDLHQLAATLERMAEDFARPPGLTNDHRPAPTVRVDRRPEPEPGART